MFRHMCALLCAILVVSLLNPIEARKGIGGGRHSYPKSGGLSGGGGHHYPSSGGLSGGGHGYPSSGGLSGGGGSHGYPSSGGLSGGSHGYPSSGGQSGGSHGYPSSGGVSGGNRGYPSSSGTHGYPSGGLSGSGTGHSTHQTNGHGYPPSRGSPAQTPSTTNVHYHYHYNPPQQIRYTPVHGGAPVSYPVYRGTPPTYVYQYKDSGSKYGTLLTGLALLNLGVLAGGIYAHSSNSHSTYKPQPGEVCKFGLRKENGDYEETRIDCKLITSFIYEEEAKAKSGGTNTTVTTSTVTNVTVVNTTNAVPEPAPIAPNVPVANTGFTMLPNGTLIPNNETVVHNNNSIPGITDASNNTMTSSVSVTTITNTTTVTNALDVKGKPVDVTPGMKCYVIRNSPSSNMKKTIPCGLLQTYAVQSIKPNSGIRNMPAFTTLAVVLAVFVFN